MNLFLLGAIAMGCCIAALFLLRFWFKTGDRLLVIFALSFSLMAATRVASAVTIDARADERHGYIYVVRLVAFLLILLAIIDKNRSTATAGPT